MYICMSPKVKNTILYKSLTKRLPDPLGEMHSRPLHFFIVQLKVSLSQVDVHLKRSEVNKCSASCMRTKCHSQVMHTSAAGFISFF